MSSDYFMIHLLPNEGIYFLNLRVKCNKKMNIPYEVQRDKMDPKYYV